MRGEIEKADEMRGKKNRKADVWRAKHLRVFGYRITEEMLTVTYALLEVLALWAGMLYHDDDEAKCVRQPDIQWVIAMYAVNAVTIFTIGGARMALQYQTKWTVQPTKDDLTEFIFNKSIPRRWEWDQGSTVRAFVTIGLTGIIAVFFSIAIYVSLIIVFLKITYRIFENDILRNFRCYAEERKSRTRIWAEIRKHAYTSIEIIRDILTFLSSIFYCLRIACCGPHTLFALFYDIGSWIKDALFHYLPPCHWDAEDCKTWLGFEDDNYLIWNPPDDSDDDSKEDQKCCCHPSELCASWCGCKCTYQTLDEVEAQNSSKAPPPVAEEMKEC